MGGDDDEVCTVPGELVEEGEELRKGAEVESERDEGQVNVERGWVAGRKRNSWCSGKEGVEALKGDIPEGERMAGDVEVGWGGRYRRGGGKC